MGWICCYLVKLEGYAGIVRMHIGVTNYYENNSQEIVLQSRVQRCPFFLGCNSPTYVDGDVRKDSGGVNSYAC